MEKSEESQKFSESSSDWQPPIEPEITEELPEVLRQQCNKWEQALKAEQQAQERAHTWMNCSLRCTDVLTKLNTTHLIMSLEMVS